MLCKLERHLGGFQSTVHSKLLTIYFFVFVRDNAVCTHAIFLYINETDHAFSSSHLVWNLSDMTVTLPSCSNFVLNIIGTKSNPFIVISDLMLHSKPQPEKYPSWKFLDILVLFPNDCVLISFVIPKNARKPVCNLLYSQSYSIHIHGTTESLSIRYVVFHWFMIVKIVWKRSQSEVFWKKHAIIIGSYFDQKALNNFRETFHFLCANWFGKHGKNERNEKLS